MNKNRLKTSNNIHILSKKSKLSPNKYSIYQYDKTLPIRKRKNDGIFYSPDFITKYIIEQSVKQWLTEKKQAISEKYAQTENEFWNEYLDILKNIKILDPSCGAGAFLQEAFDFLYNEYIEIQRNIYLDFDFKFYIVTENLFGVDLNHESVEITKLGLWLKSASKNDAFALLNNNIKCGNSLISDKSVSEKAFDWNVEFSEIIQRGGFDVIVGNPPYIVIKGGRFLEGYQFTDAEIKYIRNHYQTAEQQVNTYILFVEKAVELMNKTSIVSFIIPNTFLANEYSRKFRNYLLDKTQIVDIFNVGLAFEDATVETLILTLSHDKSKKTKLKIADKETFVDLVNISKLTADQKFILNINEQNLSIVQKINQHPQLYEFAKVSMGISTGNNTKFLTKEPTNEKHKKVISGSEVSRYFLHKNNYYVYYQPGLLDRARDENIFLAKEKLISQFVGKRLTFCFDNEQYYVLNTACSVVLKNEKLHIKYIMALLNSNLLDWYFHLIFSDYRETFPIMKSGNLERLPIPNISHEEQLVFIELADRMLLLHKQLNNVNEARKVVIKDEINTTDKLIDRKVYELYNISEFEIQYIEN